MRKIFNILEDVYSVESESELQEAIDTIGDGAGTIFIEAGTYTIETTIDVDGNGSLVIYGHGDNTILKPADGITVFNITDSASVLMRNFKIDASNYTILTTEAITITESNNNKVIVDNITITGDGTNGYGIKLNSNNCRIENCNIDNVVWGIHVSATNNIISGNNIINLGVNGIGIRLDTDNNIISNNISKNNSVGIYLSSTADYNTIIGNLCQENSDEGIECRGKYNNITGNTCSNNLTGVKFGAGGSTHNLASGNNCYDNDLYGIQLGDTNYNTIIGNICSGNNLNSGISGGGIWLISSDYNTITGNVCQGNVNVGIGTGYGIRIDNAPSDDNTIMSNVALGNDTNYSDNGTNTFDSTATDGDPLNKFA